MARRNVVELTCDRCGRTETQEPGEVTPEDVSELELKFPKQKVTIKWADLCKRCRDSVANYVKKIARAKDETS